MIIENFSYECYGYESADDRNLFNVSKIDDKQPPACKKGCVEDFSEKNMCLNLPKTED